MYDLSIVPAGIKANALADDNSISVTRVNAIPPSHLQFLSAARQKQIDEQDIRDTSRADPARPQDQKSPFGERPPPSHPVRPQIVAMPCRAGAFLPPIEAGC